MHRLIRHRPSPAMIVACVALVIALGGTSYAAITLPAGSVGSKQIKKNAVISSKVKNGSLTLSDISAASLSKMSRVAAASTDGTVDASDQAVATVSITAPKAGFVLVHGWVTSPDAVGQWGVWLKDETAGTYSAWIDYVTGSGTYSSSGNTAVFQVSAGVHDLSVVVVRYTALAGFTHYSSITAQFIPYGATGSPTSLGKAAHSHAQQVPVQP